MRQYIYTLRSDLLDRVVKDYIDYITNPLNEHRRGSVDEFERRFCSGYDDTPWTPTPNPLKVDQYTGETIIYNLPRPKESTAKTKIQMIVDILYRGFLNSENGAFTMKSSVLKKITDQYKYILDVLSYNLVVSITRTYTEDDKYDKTLYSIHDPKQFHLIKVDRLVKKEVDRFDKWEEEKQEERTKEIIAATSQKFVERYNHCLRQLTIDEASALSYIATEYVENTHSALSRIYTVRKISQKQNLLLSKIDDNGRLYHIGTQLQRDIKKFTNIEYSIDCKNSHPFLLVSVILNYILDGTIHINQQKEKQNTSSTLLYNLIRFLLDHNGIYVHYEFSDIVCKSLKQSGLQNQGIAKALERIECFNSVQADVWQYVYDAASGRVWDNFVEEFNEERSLVKQSIFASVVYSYGRRRDKKKEAEDRWLRAFINHYPTVYDYIVKIKRDLHRQCVESGRVRELSRPIVFHINEYASAEIKSKDEVLLPMIMMRLESEIFTEILRRLFNKRITCFGIHDAVAVIHSKLSVDDIKSVMMSVYAEHGLIPTLSVDYY